MAVSSTIVDVSPFSTNGALVLANAKGVDRDVFFRQLMAYGAIVTVVAPVVVWLLFVVLVSDHGPLRLKIANPSDPHERADTWNSQGRQTALRGWRARSRALGARLARQARRAPKPSAPCSKR